tara:strand:- start:387 stop:644 length:258 start_codon:yes stop_codon:yes gene_type:complete
MKGGMSKKAAMKACYPKRGSKKEHQKTRELGQKLYPGGRKPESQLKEKFHKKTKKNLLVKKGKAKNMPGWLKKASPYLIKKKKKK